MHLERYTNASYHQYFNHVLSKSLTLKQGPYLILFLLPGNVDKLMLESGVLPIGYFSFITVFQRL